MTALAPHRRATEAMSGARRSTSCCFFGPMLRTFFVWQSRQGLTSAAATGGTAGVTTALAARPLCTRNARSCGQSCGSGRAVGRRAHSSSDRASSGACQASGSRSQRLSAMKPDICACTIQRCARSSAACTSTEEPALLLSTRSEAGEARAILGRPRAASSARGTCISGDYYAT